MKLRFLVVVLCTAFAIAFASPASAATAAADAPTPAQVRAEKRAERQLEADYGENEAVDLGKDEAAAEKQADQGGGTSVFRMLFGLVIVVGVIYAVQWVLKRTRTSVGMKAKGQGLESRATLPLGHNRALHLVQIGDDLVLVGTAESSITALKTWTGDEAQQLLVATAPPVVEVPPASPMDAVDGVNTDGRATAFPTAGQTFQKVLDDLRARTVRK